jgi:hypothetical protein
MVNSKKSKPKNPKVSVKADVYEPDTSVVKGVPLPKKPKEVTSNKPQKQSSIISILTGKGPSVYKKDK